MRKLSYAVLFLLIISVVASCTHKFNVEANYSENNEKNKYYTIYQKMLTFTSPVKKEEAKLTPLNQRLADDNKKAADQIKTESAKFFAEYGQYVAEEKAKLAEQKKSRAKVKAGDSVEPIDTMMPQFIYELYSVDTLFVMTDEIISVLNTSYVYAGGAHGITTFTSFNYSPKTGSFLKNEQILDYTKEVQINELLKKYFVNKDSCFNTEPKLTLASAINVTDSSVRFTFSHYTLGAYYCGAPVISVPIKDLKGIYIIK